jgi:hypothetical protein
MARPNAEDPLIPLPVRLPTSTVKRLRAQATAAGCSLSDVLRSHLTLAEAKPLGKARPVKQQKYTGKLNKADPELMRALAGIGNNLNQLAHGVNHSNLLGEPIARVHILSILRNIEQKLEALAAQNAS